MKQAPASKRWRHSRLGPCGAGLPAMAAGAALLAWPGMWLVADAAAESPRRAVLEIDVEIENGHERWKNGTEWKDGAFSQSFTLNIPYLAAPGLDSVNPFDPGYGANALAEAARAEGRAAAIARQGGGSPNPFHTVLDPDRLIGVDPERMAEFAARSADCGGKRSCLMALGVEMMARNGSTGDAALLQAIAQIGADCSQSVDLSDGRAFDACMRAGGDRYAMPPDGLDISDSGPGFAEPAPERFQRWDMRWDESGGCGASVVAEYRYQAADLLNDVAGPVSGRETAVGAAEGAVIAAEMPLVCSGNQIITDVATGRMYMQSFHMPTIPVHRVILSRLRGGRLEATAPGGLPGGPDMMRQSTVAQWVTEKLVDAAREGHAERAFRIKGDMNGVSLPTGLAGVEEIVPHETDPTAWKRQTPNFHETEFVAKVTWRLKEK